MNTVWGNYSPSSYPTDGFEQFVFPAISKQYPNVPNVMDPEVPPSDSDALRKYIDLKYGTQNETTANRIVATRVTIKPGVAGRSMPIVCRALRDYICPPLRDIKDGKERECKRS
jgi:hypothetical protein